MCFACIGFEANVVSAKRNISKQRTYSARDSREYVRKEREAFRLDGGEDV